ncbi:MULTISPECIES: DUF1016 N-terminal domain-containing protein [Chromatiaceae]|uniref:YhcG N-terminal domain-containing protein n=1 Tax=Lamprobacter modestohalophilus TaxID=1064514 RepID=A0A9X1B4K9_9GAMM|nr:MULTISPECIES: DUF1016 N-terminal domain-containing protein [Chromatiaceae]MBK1618737.1 hypothetical protein [Lamprobacter modestohalophilus]MBK5939980.1 hypothetical protein [Halochromatium roseum]MCF7993605.1 DUF1016 N-terminal domain-containing protein [Chromatiaceae bacterium]
MSEPNDLNDAPDRLLGELRGMITDAREQLAQTANAALTMLYWNLGSRLHREILGEKRAEYGTQIVAAVGRQLSGWLGSAFSEENLWRMIQFAEAFSSKPRRLTRR